MSFFKSSRKSLARGLKEVAPIFLLVLASCATNYNSVSASKGSRLYVLKNAEIDGKSVQVLKSEAGVSILATRSCVHINFGTNSYINIVFDENSLKPKDILLMTAGSADTPEQSIWDINADGIPDMRSIKGEEANQILYQGSWYYKRNLGTNMVIIYKGKPTNVFFDGSAWCENTNLVSPPKSEATSPDFGVR